MVVMYYEHDIYEFIKMILLCRTHWQIFIIHTLLLAILAYKNVLLYTYSQFMNTNYKIVKYMFRFEFTTTPKCTTLKGEMFFAFLCSKIF